jgi:hypothetical protein
MHEQTLRSEFACFNVAVVKATNATANSNTTDTTTITATAAANYATAFRTANTIAPPTTATPPKRPVAP